METADLSAKTVLVVGANVGIGFEASKHFARMQPERLIIACRSESKERLLWPVCITTFYLSNLMTRLTSLKKLSKKLDTMDANSG